jgi:hypothetical protein
MKINFQKPSQVSSKLLKTIFYFDFNKLWIINESIIANTLNNLSISNGL